MRCCALGKRVWEPLVMGKWTPEGGGVEWHPVRISRVETAQVSAMAELMRYCRPTVWSITNKQVMSVIERGGASMSIHGNRCVHSSGGHGIRTNSPAST